MHFFLSWSTALISDTKKSLQKHVDTQVWAKQIICGDLQMLNYPQWVQTTNNKEGSVREHWSMGMEPNASMLNLINVTGRLPSRFFFFSIGHVNQRRVMKTQKRQISGSVFNSNLELILFLLWPCLDIGGGTLWFSEIPSDLKYSCILINLVRFWDNSSHRHVVWDTGNLKQHLYKTREHV